MNFMYIHLFFHISIVAGDLEKLFTYYEIIPKDALHSPARVKRSLNHHFAFDIQFKQRSYRLLLNERLSDVTSNDFKAFEVDGDGRKVQIFPQYNLFHGTVEGVNNSKTSAMFGSDEKLDLATLETDDTHLVVEPLRRYKRYRRDVDGDSRDGLKSHEEYIIYSAQDVKTLRSAHRPPCHTLDQSDERKVHNNEDADEIDDDDEEEIADGDIDTGNQNHADIKNKQENTKNGSKQIPKNTEIINEKAPNTTNNKNNKIKNNGTNNTNRETTRQTKRKTKRGTPLCRSADYKVCELMMVVDYAFFKDIGDENSALTTRLVISLVDQVNSIFRNVPFGDCGSGFVFRISNMHIYNSYNKNPKHFNTNAPLNPRTLLQYFSYTPELKEHCLGHLLTARAFQNDTLGLSNVATSYLPDKWRVSHGGVCSNHFANLFNTSIYTNTGFTTFKNSYVDKIPTLQASLVFAHELAHSLGSGHDETTECLPSKYPGKFLMYTYAVTGFEPNNRRLSVCSRRKIYKVLKLKAQYCFKALKKNYCGNHKIEEGEECDEGMVRGEHRVCCDLNTCMLKPTSQCSDLNHDCCHNCHYASNTTQCGAKDNCHSPAYCSGTGAKCGEALPINNDQECVTGNGERGRCRSGKCLTLCHYHHSESCLCAGEDTCKVCCKHNSSNDHDSTTHVQEGSDYDHDIREFLGRKRVRRGDVVDGGACHVLLPSVMLLNGTPCTIGFCSNGVCMKAERSLLNSLWEVLRINDINQFVIVIKNNIIGCIIITSLLIWIPAIFLINRYDERRNERAVKECQKYSIHNKELVSLGDNVSIKKSSVRKG